MTTDAMAAYIALCLIGFALSALYSGLETGLYTINRVRLAVRAGRGERVAMRLRREMADTNRTLSTLLIGTNASNYAASFAVAEILHQVGLADWTLIVLEAALFTPLLFIFAETLPKDLFRTFTDRWTYRLCFMLTGSRWIFTACGMLPFVQLGSAALRRLLRVTGTDAVSARQRISQLIKEGVGSGVLTESQTSLADRALAVRGRQVEGEMVPWAAVVRIPLDADQATREAVIRSRPYTRMPVVDGRGRAVGILAALDALLAPEAATAELMVEPLTFDAKTPVRQALRSMRAERRKMAVILGPPDDRPVGVVTLKDLVEPVTGELGAW